MIFVVTNRKLIEDEDFFSVIERVSKSKADYIILREKDLSHNELLCLSKKVKIITDKYNMPLIINGDLKIAEKIKAYGCQLGYETFKKLNLPLNKITIKIGVSIHNIQEAKEAEKLGANYVVAGHVFETNCKKGVKPRGVNFIKDIAKAIKIPVIAIGGINKTNVRAVLQSNAKGIAIMSSAMGKENFEIIKNLKKQKQIDK